MIASGLVLYKLRFELWNIIADLMKPRFGDDDVCDSIWKSEGLKKYPFMLRSRNTNAVQRYLGLGSFFHCGFPLVRFWPAPQIAAMRFVKIRYGLASPPSSPSGPCSQHAEVVRPQSPKPVACHTKEYKSGYWGVAHSSQGVCTILLRNKLNPICGFVLYMSNLKIEHLDRYRDTSS